VSKPTHPFRVAHIVEWQPSGAAFFALLRGDVIVARCRSWDEAASAYRAALRDYRGNRFDTSEQIRRWVPG
jgi:hypothetical protein